jgi:hypothetical protein
MANATDPIERFAGVLGNYAGGIKEPNPDDRELAEPADALRRALDVVYRQRITFKGEDWNRLGRS